MRALAARAATNAFAAGVVAWCAGGLAGCDGGRGGGAARADAEVIWRDRCVKCHGVEGRGDGAQAGREGPRPRDLGDVAWQGSVDDARLRRVIVSGGPAVGLSKAMPGSPDLAERPEVLGALVTRVRGLGR